MTILHDTRKPISIFLPSLLQHENIGGNAGNGLILISQVFLVSQSYLVIFIQTFYFLKIIICQLHENQMTEGPPIPQQSFCIFYVTSFSRYFISTRSRSRLSSFDPHLKVFLVIKHMTILCEELKKKRQTRRQTDIRSHESSWQQQSDVLYVTHNSAFSQEENRVREWSTQHSAGFPHYRKEMQPIWR